MKFIDLEVRVIAEDDRREALRFAVPDEARWIAQDECGDIWWYAERPASNRDCWYGSWESDCVLGSGVRNSRWREAIVEV